MLLSGFASDMNVLNSTKALVGHGPNASVQVFLNASKSVQQPPMKKKKKRQKKKLQPPMKKKAAKNDLQTFTLNP